MDSVRRRGYAGLGDEEGGAGPEFIEFQDVKPWYRRRPIQALMVFAATALVLGIVLAIVIPVALNKDSDANGDDKRVFGLDDIFDTTTDSLSIKWWCPNTPSPSAAFTYQGTPSLSGNIIKQTVTNETRSFPDEPNQEVLFNKTAFIDASADNAWAKSIGAYEISPSGDEILFAVNRTDRWRHSYFANFYVYSISAKTATLLDEQNRLLMNPTWSDASSNIAFVLDNNIYVKNTADNTVRQVTTDGTATRQADGLSIVNGVQSWVYEEEVFSDMTAMWWSTDGAHLAYLKFNETLVPEFPLPIYNGDAYPKIESLAYPKPGYPNPQVTVSVYSVANASTTDLDWSESGSYEYVTGVWWVDAAVVAVRRLNRFQNEEQTVLFNVVDGSSRVLFTKTSKAWIETQFELNFLRETDGSVLYFVDLVANSNSFPQARAHRPLLPMNLARVLIVALYNYTTGEFIRFLSDPTDSAKWEVTHINQWLPATRTLVYTSTEVSPQERHVYAQEIDGDKGASKVSPSAGWWSASYSACSNLFTLSYGGNGDLLSVPSVHLYDSQNAEVKMALVTNAQLKEKMSSLNLPRKAYLTVPNAAGEPMSASLLYPPDFDEKKKYPMLMRTYGGPNSQEVTRTFPLGGQKSFDLYMASRGFIVGQVDGRGTAAKGEAWRHAVYLNLGTYETQDQLAGARHFSKLDYVDASRIGLWGWSYGGYLGGFVGSAPEAEGTLKLAMSVAPVTDWRFYDSIYTERYMRTPENNPGGYANSSVLNRAEGFGKIKYLLAHGTADDNVHLQNAAELSKVLVKQGVDFEQMYYTNSDHSINTDNSRRHLYRLMSRFVADNL